VLGSYYVDQSTSWIAFSVAVFCCRLEFPTNQHCKISFYYENEDDDDDDDDDEV